MMMAQSLSPLALFHNLVVFLIGYMIGNILTGRYHEACRLQAGGISDNNTL